MPYREYNDRRRQGVRSSTSPSPRSIEEDFEAKIRKLGPNQYPLQGLSTIFGTGAAPKGLKIVTNQLHTYDPVDKIDLGRMGASGDSETRYAVVKPLQISRPETANSLLYDVQDKFYIAETGNVVQVVMTPTSSITLNDGSELNLSTTILANGAVTNRTAPGYIAIRNVQPYPLRTIPASGSTIMNQGRTIWESQRIQAQSQYNDPIYDCNFVEHKERVLIFTDEQKNLMQSKHSTPDFNVQQEQTMDNMKIDVEMNAFFSERAMETNSPRAMRHMRGLVNAIQTNISVYNPNSILDYETLIGDFMLHQAFKYNNPAGGYKKIAICGDKFAQNFSRAFKEYRREPSVNIQNKYAGLNVSKYHVNDKFELVIMPNSILRTGTIWQDWCFVIDPTCANWRIRKNYKTKYYESPDERDVKLMVEWQGTMAWNIEQYMALLRTP